MISKLFTRALPTFSLLADNYWAGLLMPEITVFTHRISYILCNKMHLMHKNYFANYKHFPGASIKFQEIFRISRRMSNSRRFTGCPRVVETLCMITMMDTRGLDGRDAQECLWDWVKDNSLVPPVSMFRREVVVHLLATLHDWTNINHRTYLLKWVNN